jgi:hypothetical protein
MARKGKRPKRVSQTATSATISSGRATFRHTDQFDPDALAQLDADGAPPVSYQLPHW